MEQEGVTITHDEALRLIDEQIGERVFLALFVSRAESESGSVGPIPLIHTSGRLVNPFPDRSPRLEPDIGYYGFGRSIDALLFPPLAGKIKLRDNGIDFLISETTSIPVAWRGSREIGDGPDAGRLARLRILGIAREDEAANDGPSLDLRRFLSQAIRAPAEIVSATPTDFSFDDKAGETRRIWEVTVRVMVAGAETFEATVQVGWQLSEKIEEGLARGDSLTGVPAAPEVLEVAFDPSDRDQVMVGSVGSSGDRPPRFKALMVGRSPDRAEPKDLS